MTWGLSEETWRRRCAQSQQRSNDRRHAMPGHCWPRKGEWLEALLIAMLVMVLGYGLLLLASLATMP